MYGVTAVRTQPPTRELSIDRVGENRLAKNGHRLCGYSNYRMNRMLVLRK